MVLYLDVNSRITIWENSMEDTNITVQYWQCQECGHRDIFRPMPKDREKFYARISQGIIHTCPKCHSESFMLIEYIC